METNDDKMFLTTLREQDGMRVVQGAKDGSEYQTRVRVREQCNPTDPDLLQVSVTSSDYNCEVIKHSVDWQSPIH